MSEETGWVCTEPEPTEDTQPEPTEDTQPEPTEDTHRTVRIWATMETELYLDINVPINVDDDEVHRFALEGGISGEDMVEDPDPFAGSWVWEDVMSVDKFDPTATDYSTDARAYWYGRSTNY